MSAAAWLGIWVFARQLTALPLRPDQMNAHRHMHNSSSQGMQSFHKDSQRNKPPNHLPRSLFVFYVRSSRLSMGAIR